ncbi:G-protein-coupled receptor family 3 [Tieghemostelium lacteum]|uniref:G-protein-coupled receptor family 3 n=1 Tax=Tieghemostelium lacteum TaxID=361077 RepID=A0A152A9H4_TIELA|nr:G-protein-coupled receptor family 3 [Tieghemostelium lacteum]|eukprot:KYR02864.1 G-protein-coupled receptor family 3 [Tieghemostelium lacteum]
MKYLYIYIYLLISVSTVLSIYDENIKIAIISSEHPNDLGYNYQVNEAKVNVEKYLKLRNVNYFSGVHDDPYIFMENLIVNEGYKIIIVATYDFTYQAADLSDHYPNTQFLTRTVYSKDNTKQNNLQYVNYDFAGANFFTGLFAGYATKTNKVGYIQPGEPISGEYPAHAFFLGARMANPNVEAYNIITGSWSNIEISSRATQKLIDDYNVDIFGQTQDDMTVSITAVDNGFVGMGTNGFNQQKVFGDKIGFSYILNWTDCFLDLVINTMDHPDGNFNHTTCYGTWGNGFLTYNFATNIDPFIIEEMEKKLDPIIADDSKLFFCSQLNPYLFNGSLLDTNNCVLESDYFFNLTDPYPGMTSLGVYQIPLTLKQVPQPFTYGICIACGILILLALIMQVIVWMNKNRSIIRSASPIFCLLIIMGGILVYIGIIFWSIPPTNARCNLRIWFVSIGFTILIGSLVVKNFRIWLIFDNPELKTIKITNYQLIPWIGALILINGILMGAITGAGDLKSIMEIGTDDLGKYEFQNVCQMSNRGSIPLYILLGYFAVLLLIGVFVSWKIRIVDIAEFNESKPIANTLYAISFSLFIIISLVVSPQYYMDEQIILAIAGLFMATAALAIIFIPKIYGLIIKPASLDNTLYTKKKSSVSTSRSSGSKNSNGNSNEVKSVDSQNRVNNSTDVKKSKNSKNSKNSNQPQQLNNIMLKDFTDESDLSEEPDNVSDHQPTIPKENILVLAEFTDDSDLSDNEYIQENV